MELQKRVYHQISITNQWNSDATYEAKPVVYNESLPSPLLKECKDWEMGIDRFDVDSTHMPLYYWPVVPNNTLHGNTDWTLSNLIVTLTYSGFTFSQPIHLIRRNFVAPIPPTPQLNSPWQVSPHYFIYYIDHLVEMINAALQAAFTGLGLLVVLPVGSTAPLVIYDNTTRCLSVLCEQAFYHDGLANPIQIWMNNNLEGVFGNLYVHWYPNDPIDHHEALLVVSNLIENIVVIAGTTYLKIDQPYPNLYALCSFRYMEFRSNMLSVVKETHNSLDLSTYDNASLEKKGIGILIDYEVILSDIMAVRSSSWVYTSGGIPSWISLNDTPELSNIDLQIYLKDAEGRSYPFYLEPGKSATIKMMWRLKKTI